MTDPISTLASKEKRAQLARLLEDRAQASVQSFALSYGQQGLWFLNRLAPESSAYHFVSRVRILSALDVDALRRAFQMLVDSQPMLRVHFSVEGGEPRQSVEDEHTVNFEVHDATGWSAEQLEDAVEIAVRHPFDLEQGPVYRVRLYTRERAPHVLLLVVHHIVFDAVSAEAVIEDLGRFYTSARSGSSEAPPRTNEVPYRRFVDWQRDFLSNTEGQRQLDYWKQQLAGPLPMLDLPTDHARQPIRRYRGGSVPLTFTAERVRGLKALARGLEVNVYTVVLAAFHLLLHRYSGQSETLVGVPTIGRTRSHFERMLGYFVNLVVVRVDFEMNSPFSELVRGVRRTLVEALANQDYPFSLLVEKLRPDRDTSRNPVFQAMVDWQRGERLGGAGPASATSAPSIHIDLGELKMEAQILLAQQEGQVDLALDVKEFGDALFGNLKYDADLIDAPTATRMQAHLQALIDSALADPEHPIGRLQLLTDSERTRMLVDWNRTGREHENLDAVHKMFDRAAVATPSAPAVTCGARTLSYGELAARANQVARYLRGVGVGRDTPVAIYLSRSIDLLVALLGVLKAGGAYLPLDPTYPIERIEYMLTDCGARAIVTEERLHSGLPALGCSVLRMDADRETLAGFDTTSPAGVDTGADDLAYIIYTSGSTGLPKGVEVRHGGMSNFLGSMRRNPGIRSDDVLLAITTISFDIHVLELFLPLVTGAHLEIATEDTARDGRALLERLRRGDVSIMQATPTTWQMVINAGWDEPFDLKILCGGEGMPQELARQLRALGSSLWNMYGPTETTVWSATCEIDDDDSAISVGQPIDNTTLYILDEHMEPLPIGLTGELYIGGHGLARGYRNLPEQTKERFVANPFADGCGDRLYRAGDRARYRDDGRVEVLGRTDYQIKLRGHRIELGEVETTLVAHAAVRSCVAVVRTEDDGDARIVAYAVADNASEVADADLRSFMRQRLPEYMMPSDIVLIDTFPLTPNGKIDRAALPAPTRTRAPDVNDGAAPVGHLETVMAHIWADVLNVDDVRAYDMFFDLGGHSLLSLMVIDRFEKETGFRMNPEELVNQTLRQLVTRFEQEVSPASELDGGHNRGLLDAFKSIVSRRR